MELAVEVMVKSTQGPCDDGKASHRGEKGLVGGGPDFFLAMNLAMVARKAWHPLRPSR